MPDGLAIRPVHKWAFLAMSNSAHRKGAAFGLSTAEVMAVYAFVLLLLIATTFEISNQERVEVEEMRKQAEVEAMQVKRYEIRLRTVNSQLAQMVAQSAQTVEALQAAEVQLESSRENYQALEALLSSEQLSNELLEGEQLKMREEVVDLRNQLACARGDPACTTGGYGTPPCWYSDKGMRDPDAIYNAFLYEQGVHIEPRLDIISKERTTGQPQWDEFPGAAQLKRPRFFKSDDANSLLSALFEHGNANGCHFHVRVFDYCTQTKQAYKDHIANIDRYVLSHQPRTEEKPTRRAPRCRT